MIVFTCVVWLTNDPMFAETQKLKLQELREEVAKLKKNQAETAEQVDELQARLDLEMKARLEGEKSLKHEQKKREAWESRYKQEVKFRYGYADIYGLCRSTSWY